MDDLHVRRASQLQRRASDKLRRKATCAVIVPCYRVVQHVEDVVSRIGDEVQHIICVDDACPDGSGRHILSCITDPRVEVLTHERNQGVGGAMVTGYRRALELGVEIAVKLDGDGQMDPGLIPLLINPIKNGSADYTKGNRFYNLESLRSMPIVRRFGNAVLSLITKSSSGYWNLFDPTNGFTAIHVSALKRLSLDKLSKRYFFESDMLFQLNIIRAVVIDIPMEAVYADERSNLSVMRQIVPFAAGNMRNGVKRFFYNYLLRDFNIASVFALLGLPLVLFGAVFGVIEWIASVNTDTPATAGTVMVAALPIIVGLEMLLSALNYDFSNLPTLPLCRLDELTGLDETQPHS